jgi:hypothetical protein
MPQCIKILFHIYMKLSMFRATHRPSSRGSSETLISLYENTRRHVADERNFITPCLTEHSVSSILCQPAARYCWV